MLFCLVPRLHYSARPKRFGSCGPSEDVRPRQKSSELRQLMRQPCPQGLLAFQYYGAAILESEKTLGTRLFLCLPDFGVRERDSALHLSSKTFVEHARHVAKI